MAETTPDRARLRALCEQATEGEWFTHRNAKVWHVKSERAWIAQMHLRGDYAEPDAEYIAAANPQTVLALLDQLDQQAETIQRLETDSRVLARLRQTMHMNEKTNGFEAQSWLAELSGIERLERK